MPIKPENRARYPKNWKEIRQKILERAGHKCEQCGLPNHVWGYRLPGGEFMNVLDPLAPDTFRGKHAAEKLFQIVLTIAHLDHVPENCAEKNLKAMCQRCHLRYDSEHHRKNAKATREAKKCTPGR